MIKLKNPVISTEYPLTEKRKAYLNNIIFRSANPTLDEAILSRFPSQQKQLILSTYEKERALNEGNLRKTGWGTITHIYGVVLILNELLVDLETLIGGIIHDRIENDTEIKAYTEEVDEINYILRLRQQRKKEDEQSPEIDLTTKFIQSSITYSHKKGGLSSEIAEIANNALYAQEKLKKIYGNDPNLGGLEEIKNSGLDALENYLNEKKKGIITEIGETREKKIVQVKSQIEDDIVKLGKDYFPDGLGDALKIVLRRVTRDEEIRTYKESCEAVYNLDPDIEESYEIRHLIYAGIPLPLYVETPLPQRMKTIVLRGADSVYNMGDVYEKSADGSFIIDGEKSFKYADVLHNVYKRVVNFHFTGKFFSDVDKMNIDRGPVEHILDWIYKVRYLSIDMTGLRLQELKDRLKSKLSGTDITDIERGIRKLPIEEFLSVTIDISGDSYLHNNLASLEKMDAGDKEIKVIYNKDPAKVYAAASELIAMANIFKEHTKAMIDGWGHWSRGYLV